MTQSERRFGKCRHFARAEFDDLQSAFIGDGSQSARADKTGARTSKGRDLGRSFCGSRDEVPARIGHLRHDFAELRKVIQFEIDIMRNE